VAYYWNRRGLVSSWFISRFCRELQIDRLLYRPDIDPGVKASYAYQLPSWIGSTKVEIIGWMENSDQYAERIASANIVFAPRPSEGVGMVMLEALARGACTIGYNAATMNEYIQSGRNGLLLTWCAKPSFSTFALRAGVKASELLRIDRTALGLKRQAISFHQDWHALSKIDLQRLGDQARRDHFMGSLTWNDSLPSLVSFLIS
jgi:glycosyltransferase involved in cell wall biosynthesis